MTDAMLNSLTLPGGMTVGRQAHPRRQLLESVPGLTLGGDHQGELLVDGQAARLHIEAIDLLRVALAIDEPPSPLGALQQTRELPGNMRHAIAQGHPVVLTEVAMDAAAADAIRNDMARVRAGLSQAIGHGVEAPPDATPLTKESVANALADSTIADEDIVDLETQWEIRTRWHEDAMVVRVKIDGRSLRFSRVLIKELPEGEQASALAHHALRLNSQLRQCRLGATETQLVAETLLPGDAMDANNINKAARAVAVAARHCGPTLTVLASQGELAQEYTDMFVKS